MNISRVVRLLVLIALTMNAYPQEQGTKLELSQIDVSVDLLVAAGGSSAENAELATLQLGGHDPAKNGFTLQAAELSFSASVDPFFRAETHALFTEEGAELEEAFATSTALPGGFEVKAGYYLTEFGRLNATHPHQWYWLDQPFLLSRLLGSDGLRSTGARLAWLLPAPWYAQLYAGIQNADDDSAVSFLGGGHRHGAAEAHDHTDETSLEEYEHHEYEATPIAGRPRVDRSPRELDEYLYSLRLETSLNTGEEFTTLVGASALAGPNAAGTDSQTRLYGADLTIKWRPVNNRRGYPFLLWQSEVLQREYEAGYVALPHGEHEHAYPAETIRDWGFYSQFVYGFAPRWECGFRVEYGSGNDAGVIERDHDEWRSDRLRLSPMLAYRPSEFSRVRLQYNYDDADHLDDVVHTVWLGLEVSFGKHPAHSF